MKYYPFLLLLIFNLSACHVGNEYTIDYFIDDEQVKNELSLDSNSQNISHNWYDIFDDEDLNTLLNFALKDNFSIKSGIEKLYQSRYTYLIQSKNNFPLLDGSFTYTFDKTENSKLKIDNTNLFKVGFDVSWEIDLWGKGEYTSQRYLNLVKNSQYTLLQLMITITSEVIVNYIGLREAQQKLYITEKNLQIQTETLNLIKNKHSLGLVDDLAISQAQYVVDNTASSIPILQAQIETYKNTLAVLLGTTLQQMPANLDFCKKNIVAKTFKYSVKKLHQLPLSIIRTRPDVLAAEASVKAQNQAVNEAITDLYPSISLDAAFGYISSSGHSLFNSNNQSYSYQPFVSIPIWHWGQLSNNILLQKHQREEYVQNFNNKLITALTEIKNAIKNIESSYASNRHKQSSFNKMQNILSLTQDKYINGLIDFTDVANAEQSLLSSQLDLISNNADILRYIVAFYKATGGGYNFKQ